MTAGFCSICHFLSMWCFWWFFGHFCSYVSVQSFLFGCFHFYKCVLGLSKFAFLQCVCAHAPMFLVMQILLMLPISTTNVSISIDAINLILFIFNNCCHSCVHSLCSFLLASSSLPLFLVGGHTIVIIFDQFSENSLFSNHNVFCCVGPMIAIFDPIIIFMS